MSDEVQQNSSQPTSWLLLAEKCRESADDTNASARLFALFCFLGMTLALGACLGSRYFVAALDMVLVWFAYRQYWRCRERKAVWLYLADQMTRLHKLDPGDTQWDAAYDQVDAGLNSLAHKLGCK